MKLLLLDADGVVLKQTSYFSTYYEKEKKLPEHTLAEFFKTDFVRCQEGKADLKEVLVDYLPEWKWIGTVDSFLEYWFAYDLHLNVRVMERVNELRQSGVKCCLASNQEKYRAEFIQNLLEQNSPLDHYFFSSSIGHRKESPEFFKSIIKKLHIKPKEMTYLDNDEKNLNAARACGIQSSLYNDATLTELTAS